MCRQTKDISSFCLHVAILYCNNAVLVVRFRFWQQLVCGKDRALPWNFWCCSHKVRWKVSQIFQLNWSGTVVFHFVAVSHHHCPFWWESLLIYACMPPTVEMLMWIYCIWAVSRRVPVLVVACFLEWLSCQVEFVGKSVTSTDWSQNMHIINFFVSGLGHFEWHWQFIWPFRLQGLIKKKSIGLGQWLTLKKKCVL